MALIMTILRVVLATVFIIVSVPFALLYAASGAIMNVCIDSAAYILRIERRTEE